MMYPLVLDLAADGVPVTVTCRVLGFSTQAFYKWRKAPLSQRDWDDAHLINAAREIHADDPAFGDPCAALFHRLGCRADEHAGGSRPRAGRGAKGRGGRIARLRAGHRDTQPGVIPAQAGIQSKYAVAASCFPGLRATGSRRAPG